MISKQDNETLTRVGPGTEMGDFMRSYWLPVALSAELPEPDGAPIRVRILGEDLVAFRNTDGKVGLLDEFCPHRAASLVLAVNEENGLRCIYHGWKYAVDGSCVDIPTEPKGSAFCSRVKAKAYPTREAGGMVWAYLGKTELEPPFPEYEWFKLPTEHCFASKVLGECNYAQLVEGTIDSAHAGVLHRRSPWTKKFDAVVFEEILKVDLELEYTAYGIRYAGLRETEPGKFNARVTALAMPVTTLIPPFETGATPNRRLVNVFVPRDDENTWVMQFVFDPVKPVDAEQRIREGGLYVDKDFRKLSNRDNLYNQDRQMMKESNFSGITGILVQDHAVGESQGRILDRSKEFLGTSDLCVTAWRRQMIKGAKALRQNAVQPVGTAPGIPYQLVSACTVTVDKNNGESWKTKASLPPELVNAS
ncbi:Rieske 2Fe-2S domain-containing protein [Caballeronia sordidicola]|uniref:Phthalate 4,5-dioxygenase oxygenase subunit (OhpA2) n=1 Tax=Caballeronia sordidicola TaxID=196367 RepID=A0A226WZX0_CABSO|nr:Rieske 2Fe-2S domain-containing protein [Caballeronia sordidicola]OXC76724.1 Phthalate 4,5-dioxygenase oxygenase subunit (OhpA2) [Caballeronia sordidicola]